MASMLSSSPEYSIPFRFPNLYMVAVSIAMAYTREECVYNLKSIWGHLVIPKVRCSEYTIRFAIPKGLWL